MGQNHDTPNPPRLPLADAMAQAENAMANLEGVRALMGAIAGCTFQIEPCALFPVRDAVDTIMSDLEEAWQVLFAALRAPEVAS